MTRSALLTNPWASSQGVALPRRFLLILSASLAIAVTSHIAFPLPYTPVPFTLQPLAILLAGLLLGPLDGALAVLLYLAEGAAGLPVFSPTGPGGLAQLLGPTGGYLFADPLVAFLAGYLSRRFSVYLTTFAAALLGCTLAIAVLFLSGTAWLDHVHPASVRVLYHLAVLPFLPGEAVKIVLAASLLRTVNSRSSQ